MHLWHNELRPRRLTTHRAEKVGSQDTHPKGAVCVPRSGSTFRVEDRERRATRASRAPRISCPQTLTPSGQSSSNRDFEQPSRLEMLGKENQTTRSNAGNYGSKTRFPVKCSQTRMSWIIEDTRSVYSKGWDASKWSRLLQESSGLGRKGAIKRYERSKLSAN